MNITSGALARTIVLGLAFINQILSTAGYPVLPFENEQVETFVTLAWTIIASGVAWWKNNSFTRAAQAGDKITKAIKNGKISTSVADNVLK